MKLYLRLVFYLGYVISLPEFFEVKLYVLSATFLLKQFVCLQIKCFVKTKKRKRNVLVVVRNCDQLVANATEN